MEGLYIKVENGGIVRERYKFVRRSFVSRSECFGSAGGRGAIVPNVLRDGVDIFSVTAYSPTTRIRMTEILENLSRHVFFHGTSLEAARGIHERGFQVWFMDEEFGQYCSGGNLGTGIYITCSWTTALWFGHVLLRVELQPGTRILDASRPPDPALIGYLQREFGREVLKASPWKAIPRNKQFTLPELIALVRYHYRSTWTRENWKRPRRFRKHVRLLHHFRSMLVRYGFDGYGNPADDNGIVIFAGDRLRLVELVAEVPWSALTPEQQRAFPDCLETLEQLSSLYVAEGTDAAKNLGASILRMRTAEHGEPS